MISNRDPGPLQHELTVLLPGFDDGRWIDNSFVTEDGLQVMLDHPRYTGMTMCSKMWEHEDSIYDVLQCFSEYLERRRRVFG